MILVNYSLQETRRSYTRFLKSTKNKNITVLAKIGLFSVFSLIILMIIPAYADVGIAMIEEERFTLDDKFTISGTINDEETVLLTAVIRGPGGEKYPNKNRKRFFQKNKNVDFARETNLVPQTLVCKN